MAAIPAKSRAAALVEYSKPLELREYPVPELEPRGTLVKVELAGICGSDVHQWHGRSGLKPPLPNIPGHETVGRIVQLGAERSRDAAGSPLHVGDLVLYSHVDCGECYWCKTARQPTLCINRMYYGYRNPNEYPYLMGGFAEYAYIHPKSEIAKIPSELTAEEAVGVGCAFRTVVHAFERLGGIGMQETILVQGAGPVGLYATVLAAESGAGRVIVVGAPRPRLELARTWGAAAVIDIDEVRDAEERRRQVLELTGGIGPDIVIDCSGVPAAVGEGVDLVRRGGKILMIGQTSQAPTTITPGVLVWKQVNIVASISATIVHYQRALEFIRNKRTKYPFGAIITNKYPLENATEALRAMEAGREIKAVIDVRAR